MKRSNFLFILSMIAFLWSLGVQGAESYRLGVNDVVRISVYGHPELDVVAQIAADGSIRFPAVGELSIAGLTPREAERRLAESLVRKEIVKDPQVSLVIDKYQSQMVTMLGQVANPGVYVMTRDSTLMDLVSQAGGLKEDAGDTAVLTRKAGGSESRVVVDLLALMEGRSATPEPKVADGDRIFIPRMELFYVYGEVNRPGAYRLAPGMTVMQALSVAGGLTDKGTDRGLKIRRKTSHGVEQQLPAELTHSIEPSDVIQVKESLF
ncbi:SLBB domain-containing protein [Thiocystis violacea]|uniref:SLBB domain-containing protein n=1 Tax=Thiocystis violacea TaxID=13725 RepID=UPI0019045080|nr:SLBB domain-containing protein [Thiocystis violacea]